MFWYKHKPYSLNSWTDFLFCMVWVLFDLAFSTTRENKTEIIQKPKMKGVLGKNTLQIVYFLWAFTLWIHSQISSK